MQVVKLDLGMQSGPANFFCPFTGINLNSDEGLEKCENVVTAIHWEVPESPLCGSDEVIQSIEDLCSEEENYELDPTEILLKLFANEEDLIVFEVTSGGMACGPTWSTVSYVLKIK